VVAHPFFALPLSLGHVGAARNFLLGFKKKM
jgi:hypothetical protein